MSLLTDVKHLKSCWAPQRHLGTWGRARRACPPTNKYPLQMAYAAASLPVVVRKNTDEVPCPLRAALPRQLSVARKPAETTGQVKS
eukprot:10989184-Alexandrium_andersonii.AAC.1